MMIGRDWKKVLRRAWSVRLIVLAGLLSGVELVLPLWQFDLPRGIYAAAMLVLTTAALVARLMAQRGFK